MSYVGNPLATAFAPRVKQDLTGQSGTSFTLSHAVSSANDLSVYINHVRQEPTTAYTVDYTTLTTTGTVASTDDFYIIFDELALQSIAHDETLAMKATSGTFTGAITTTQMASSGPVSGTTGTFSGALSANADTDTTNTLGRAIIHSPTSDAATFSHVDKTALTDYALLHSSTGTTYVNASTGRSINFNINNSNIASISANGLAATLTTAAQPNVTSVGTLASDLTISRAETNGTVRLNLSNTGSNGSTEYSEIKLNSTAGSTQTSVVQHRNNYGLNIGTTTDHAVYLLQNNNSIMSIDTNESVGIGRSLTNNNNSGYQNLTIGGANATTGSLIDMENSSGLVIATLNASSGRLYLGVDPYNANGGSEMVFEVDGSAKAKLDGSGNLNILSGNIVIGTAGKGIDFSAQTTATGDGTENPSVSSEVLDHYEYGTFKPKVVSSGATFDYQGSGNQYGSGYYTRIGDIVFVDMNFDSDGGISGTTSNSLQIHNMPFNNNTGTSMNVLYFYRRVANSSYPHIMCSIYNTQIGFLMSPNSGQWADMPASNVNFSDHRMKITGCYHIG